MGNLFTMDEWHNLWLKEATAEIFCHKSFAGILADREKYGLSTRAFKSEDIWINFVVRTGLNNRNETWPFDDRESFAVCFKEEEYFDRMMDFYGTIVYQKGASYLRNLEFLIGAQRFRQLFVSIIEKYSYSNLNGQDFLSILLDLTKDESYPTPAHLSDGETLPEVCQKWFDHHIHIKGYPIVSFEELEYRPESQSFIMSLKIIQAKWTRVRTLLVGKLGQTKEVILTINPHANKDIVKSNPNLFSFIFEDIDFEPVCVIPNYQFDDFMHVMFHPQQLHYLFVILPQLPAEVTES
jgi:aminopeptidase N